MWQEYAINGATVRATVEFSNLELEVQGLFSGFEILETSKLEVGLTDSYKLNLQNRIVGRPQKQKQQNYAKHEQENKTPNPRARYQGTTFNGAAVLVATELCNLETENRTLFSELEILENGSWKLNNCQLKAEL